MTTVFDSLSSQDKERLLERIQNEKLKQSTSRMPAIPPVDRDGALALSFAQQRLWFLAQMDERVSA
ncbi:hypothetical protein, partial [Brucella sp. 22210]|uniref:hypothetical protein n=1 Tax=Brucella sp. 22210 TaxID=3453892 RepID=UPI003F84A2D8